MQWANSIADGLLPPITKEQAQRPALIDPRRPHAPISQQDLRVEVLARARRFNGAGKLLVHLPFHRSVDVVITYLALREAGHAVLLTAPNETLYAPVVDSYPPDAVVQADGKVVPAAGDGPIRDLSPRHDLHPDLAVLMTTSGTTGSAKLVRLSARNLTANAAGINAALGLGESDRAITVLPLHYSFGLSVLHTHLGCVGSVVVSECGITDEEFAAQLSRNQVTNFGCVPHMLDLWESQGGPGDDLSTVRLIYQAGGKLAAHKVTEWSRRLSPLGIDFRVMYGQTEATARMTVQPPGATQEFPEGAGAVLPGCTMEILNPTPEGVGELVFHGENVMLGYATSVADLALGRMIDRLATGDRGFINNHGIVTITGRDSDFVKIAGLRVELPRLSEILSRAGINALVTGDDESIRILVETSTSTHPEAGDPTTAVRIVRASTGIDSSHVLVARTHTLPRLPNEKPDRRRADAMVLAAAKARTQADNRRTRSSDSPRDKVFAELARIVGVPRIHPERSFADNGGNSLNQVAAAAALNRVVGTLPKNWHHRPLTDLVPEKASPVRWCELVRVDTSTVVRTIAAFTVVANHAHIADIMGGAHSLLVVAGIALALFGLQPHTAAERARSAVRTVARVAIPTVIIALIGAKYTGTHGWANVFFIWWYHPFGESSMFLWFIESYTWGILAITALFAIPPIYQTYRRWPAPTAAVLFALALGVRQLVPYIGESPEQTSPLGVLWLLVLGILIAHTEHVWIKVLVLIATVFASHDFFWTDRQRLYVLVVIAALMFIPRIPLPRFLLTPVTIVSSATLYIYLVQFDVLALEIAPQWHVVFSVALGIALWFVVAVVTGRMIPWVIENLTAAGSHRSAVAGPTNPDVARMVGSGASANVGRSL